MINFQTEIIDVLTQIIDVSSQIIDLLIQTIDFPNQIIDLLTQNIDFLPIIQWLGHRHRLNPLRSYTDWDPEVPDFRF